MCGAHLPSAALYCETCGTDLSRAGAVFSTSVSPVTRLPISRKRVIRLAALGAGAFAALLALLVGIGSIPTVSARIPAIMVIAGPIRGAISQAVGWTTDRFWVPRAKSTIPPDELATLPTGPLTSSPELAQRTPYFVVKSTPEGAFVYIDMQIVGRTPLILYDMKPGVYSVRVEHDGLFASRTITLRPNVGSTVAVRLADSTWTTGSDPKTSTPKPSQVARARTQPARKPASLELGAAAPMFSLKDRFGVIYKLSDYRGRRVAVLFVWDLDDAARRAVRNLSAGFGPRSSVVVMIRPDRPALRQFIESERIAVPILFGDAALAARYGVPEDKVVLVVVSEQGHVQSHQVARNQ